MIDSKQLDELANRLSQLAPPQWQAMRQDLSENFRAVITGWLERMDLVTRSEFDAQKAVLSRTREKLHTLEEKLNEFEQRTNRPAPTDPS